MAQEIKIEVDDHNFTTFELNAIQFLAWRFAEQDLRVTDDPTNIKIYVGSYYKEPYRFWVSPNGDIGIVEKDLDLTGEDSDWRPSSMSEATMELLIDQPRDNVVKITNPINHPLYFNP